MKDNKKHMVYIQQKTDIEISEKDKKNSSYFSLSTSQRGMWNVEQVYPNTTIGIISATVTFEPCIDFDVLDMAINLCFKNNDSFRLRVLLDDNRNPFQYVKTYEYRKIDKLFFENMDELRAYEAKLIATPFDLIDSDLHLLQMFELKDCCYGIFIKLHHLISDAWTQVLTLNQITYYYNLLRNNNQNNNQSNNQSNNQNNKQSNKQSNNQNNKQSNNQNNNYDKNSSNVANIGNATNIGKDVNVVDAANIGNVANIDNAINIFNIANDVNGDKKPSFVDCIERENAYLNSNIFSNNEEFWNNKFDSFPEFNILKPYANKNSIKANRKTFILKKELAEKIHGFVKDYNVTPFAVFMSALTIYISKITCNKDIVLGSPILTRANFKDKSTTGMFINVVPMRFNIDNDIDFVSFANYVSKEIRQYLKNGKYPYDYLLKNFKKKHKTDKIYDVLLSYQNSTINKENLFDGYSGEWHFNGYQTESLCIHIDDRDSTGEYFLNFDYLVDVFEETEIINIYEHAVGILSCACTQPQLLLSELEIVSEEEKDTILNTFNSKHLECPQDILFYEIFEEQVNLKQNSIAVVCENKALTYKELNSKANRLGRLLREKGVMRETVVGIMIKRSAEMVVAVLAILKAGGAYLPIDASYPRERIKYILNDCNSGILIVDSSVNVDGVSCQLINIDNDNDEILIQSDSNIDNINKPSDLMYVIYTSGTTGNPKGVMIEHRHFMNIAFGWKKEYLLDTFDVNLLQLASFSFDVFVGDLARTFLNGGTMIIASEEEKFSFPKLQKLINEHSINILESTPALIIPFMDFIYDNKLTMDSMELLILGSDTCLNQDFRRLMSRFGSRMRIINSYGVTEATIDSSYYEADFDEIPLTGSTPIGRPFGNSKFYILDPILNIKPIGACGELYISGNSISRGYYNNPELTKQKFLPSPFVPGEVIYKTGDIAKWLPDGNVIFAGRADTQVKIKGFRIELGEIENKIMGIIGIKESVVVAKEGSLYGFYVSDKAIGPDFVIEHLKNTLPYYMVPSSVKQLDAMPLSPNGKIDKRQLMQNYCVCSYCIEYVPPSSTVEIELSKIWAEVLELEKVGVCENFFDIGGDSLAIISILSMSYKLNWELSIQSFYEYQTIRELANFIEGNQMPSNIDAPKAYSKVARKHDEIKKIEASNNIFSSRNILLTGATGFLGIHILRDLIMETDSNVYCLIRGNHNLNNFHENHNTNNSYENLDLNNFHRENGLNNLHGGNDLNNLHGNSKIQTDSRLLELLKHYFEDELIPFVNKRIFIVYGDISHKKLGVSTTFYNELSDKIDCVVHAAALVKHYGKDKMFNRTNVVGTEKVIKFCRQGKSKRLFYISTTSVSGDTLKQESTLKFTENDFYIGQNYSDNIYIKSKFEAENLVLEALNDDLDGAIFRVGNLTGRYKDGLFQKNIEDSMFYNNLKSIISLGKIPSDMLDVELELTPVEQCSKAILKIFMLADSNKKVFHICNKGISIKKLIGLLNKSGDYMISAVNKSSFLMHIKENDETWKSVSLFLVNDYNFEKIADKNYKVKVDSDITNKYLKALDFKWAKIDSHYILKLIEHAKNVGFLEDVINDAV